MMRLNVEKCKVLHVGRNNPRTPYFMMDSSSETRRELAKTDLERDLGVYVSHDLKHRGQVAQAANKADRMLGILKRTFTHRGIDLWKKLYITYVRPQLEFAVSAWNPYQKGDTKVLEDVQHRATKVAHDLSGKPYEERLKLLGLTSLKERRVRGDLIQWFKIVNGFDHVSWMSEPRIGHARLGTRRQYILENVN